jgi:hypothetical protein
MSGAGGNGTHLCFYSNKCQWSKAFITELAQTPWKNQFRFICVDPGPARPQLPGWLKKVPTIVIAGEPEPRTDSDVMNWLYEKRMKEGQGGGGGGPGHKMGGGGGGGAGGAAAAGAGEPEAFSMMEQVSFAKGFSYSGLDVDTSSQGDGGTSMPGAFSFLGGAASMGADLDRGGAQAAAQNSGRRSKKEEMFDKQMEAYQREREMGMPRGPARM